MRPWCPNPDVVIILINNQCIAAGAIRSDNFDICDYFDVGTIRSDNFDNCDNFAAGAIRSVEANISKHCL